MRAIANRLLVPVMILVCLVGLCSCYSKDYFERSLDDQFGKDTYTLEEVQNKYKVTLKDYPELSFYVGSETAGLPYSYSGFSTVFGQAILDEYAQEANPISDLYEINRTDASIYFDLNRELTLPEAEQVYEEAMKIRTIICDKYPIYNTQDYSIGIRRFVDKSSNYQTEYSSSYLLVDCMSRGIETSPKSEFLAYENLLSDELALPDASGITIGVDTYSQTSAGSDTLRTIFLKGFHINDVPKYASMDDDMIEPGDLGASGWCSLDSAFFYKKSPMGAHTDAETMQGGSNYVFVETTNVRSEPCKLKDTVVTKVIYHFGDLEAAETSGTKLLYLDDMAGDVTAVGDGFDLWSRWDLPKPTTEEEKTNGVRYKDALVKISASIDNHNGILERIGDTPASVKQLDLEVTWSPERAG